MELSIKNAIYIINAISLLVISLILISIFQKFIKIEGKVEQVINISGPRLNVVMDLKSSIYKFTTSLAFYNLNPNQATKREYVKSKINVERIIGKVKAIKFENDEVYKHISDIEISLSKTSNANELISHDNNKWYENYPAIHLSIDNLQPISTEIVSNINDIYFSNELSEEKKLSLQELRFNWIMAMRSVGYYLSFRDEDNLSDFKLYYNGISQNLMVLKELNFKPIYKNKINLISELAYEYKSVWERVFKIHSSDEWRKDVYYFNKIFQPEVEKIISRINEITNIQIADLEDEKKNLTHVVDSNKIMMISTLLIYVFCLVGTWFVYDRKILKPINTLNENYKSSIDDLKNAKDKLVESEKMASLGSLVAGISHEINTPLGNSVTAASQLEEDYFSLKEKLEKGKMSRKDFDFFLNQCGLGLELMLINLRKASELISSFKRIAVDQTSEQIRVFDIKNHIRDITLSMSPKIKGKDIEIKTFFNFEDGDVKSYPGIFSQIITNLINNSIIHGFDHGNKKGSIEIEINKDNQLNEYQVLYRDDGQGIKDENLKNIFDPFFTTNRGAGGSGLGLHLVYNFVTQKLESDIAFDSKAGEGVFFQFNLKNIGD